MTKIIDQLTTDHATAPQRYRELIDPARDPQPGDVEGLRSVMGLLGKSPEQAKADAAALVRAAELEDEARPEAGEAASRQIREAKAELERFDEETKRLIAEREQLRKPIEATEREAFTELQRVNDAKSELRKLKAAHRDIFGLPPRRPVEAGRTTIVQTEPSAPSYRDGVRPHPISRGEYDVRTG